MPFIPSSDASPKIKVFAAYIEALSQINIDKALALCDESFETQILPASLGVPKLGKAEFRGVLQTSLVADFEALEVNVFEILEHGDLALTAHLESIGVSKLGTPWHNEYVFFVHFTEGDSPKITKMKEFVNSAVIASFAAEQAKKREELVGQ